MNLHVITSMLLLGIAATIAPPAMAAEPPTDNSHTGRQFLAGLAGTGVGFVGGGVLALAGSDGDNEYELIGRFLLGGLVGTTFGTAGGVHLAGRDENYAGSFRAAWAGAVVGTIAGIGWLAATEHKNPAIAMIGVTFPTLGAMYGFRASRHLRVQPTPVGGVRVSLAFEW